MTTDQRRRELLAKKDERIAELEQQLASVTTWSPTTLRSSVMVRITPPVLQFPGPDDTISGVLNRVAYNLDNGNDVGGSGVRQIVAKLLREVGDQLGEVNMAEVLNGRLS